MKVHFSGSFAAHAFAVVTALSLITACGDADTFKIRTSAWGDTEPLTDLSGRLVQLARATTPCDSSEAEGLLALSGSHTEFPSENVITLKSSCSDGDEARVSIDVEGRSIIYDFSNVARSGVFASADFNGYVLIDIARSNPRILGASIDRELSNLPLDDEDLFVDPHTIRANFAGRPFDETTFVKIDLIFADENDG